MRVDGQLLHGEHSSSIADNDSGIDANSPDELFQLLQKVESTSKIRSNAGDFRWLNRYRNK